MRTDEVFKSNSQSLAAKDLQGHKVTVEIEGIDVKKFDDGSKPILTFKGKEKSLILNKTNAFSIELLLGTKEMDDWIGQRITLKPDKTLFEGKMVDCIRIDDRLPPAAAVVSGARQAVARNVARQAPQPEIADVDDDSVPF